ncbi:hypothetical protein ACIBQX_11135 [Nonomuraea sp. NPDC049714]|uniref:hypothetical protein n=1 Tax=Nonomuraea sp. NPDC049714 TaxID=3364357 RepID=UPI00379E26A2
MSWLIIALVLVIAIGAVEKSDIRPAARIRGSRAYQGGRRRAIDLGSVLRGRPPLYVNGQRTDVKDLTAQVAAMSDLKPPRQPKAKRPTIAYTPPTAPAPTPAAANGSASAPGSAGITVDFFQGVLMLINAPYEGPNDALRQLRSLAEGGRQWNGGLIGLHRRMSDPADMRIDPFVADHVVRAAALGQAMVLELVEADTAMTALLNMTLAEITERGLQVPNTK